MRKWSRRAIGFYSRLPTLIATINTGDVHFGYTGGTATLGAAVGGLDLKILAAFANFVQTDFVFGPDIKTRRI